MDTSEGSHVTILYFDIFDVVVTKREVQMSYEVESSVSEESMYS